MKHMPLCRDCKTRISGVAYASRKKDGYLCLAHRDAEEKALNDEFKPIPKSELKKIRKEFSY